MNRTELEKLMTPKKRGAWKGKRPGEPYHSAAGVKVHTPEEDDFIEAVEMFKKVNKRPFPAATDYLWIAKQLGYKKVFTK